MAGGTNRRGRAAVRSARPSRAALLLAVAAATALTAGCGEQIIKHGHQFTANDVQQIQPGMTQEQVKLQLGTPTTTATLNTGAAFYYISSTASQVAFLKEKEVDRKVLAVYFNPMGSVDRVANYGMQDGKVFDFISRTTPTGGKDQNFLGQILGGFGGKKGKAPNLFGNPGG